MNDHEAKQLGGTRVQWGEISADHHGYATDAERLEKRGMEDWELVENIPESQRRVPKWFIAIIAIVLVAAFGLSFPFWGDRPGMERPWFTMGHMFAVGYLLFFGAIIYFMTTLYGSGRGGRLASDAEADFEDDDINMPSHRPGKRNNNRSKP